MIATQTVNAGLLQELDAYVGQFRGAFRRSDQARWAAVYLQGLLGAGPRKNIESLAGTAVLPPDRKSTSGIGRSARSVWVRRC